MSEHQSSMFLLSVGVCLLIAFLILQPRSVVMASAAVRQWKLQQFVTQVVRTQTFEMDRFWQLRDELGGMIEYNQTTLEPYSILHLKKLSASPSLLLTITGPQFVSKEFLFKGNDLRLVSADLTAEKIIFQNQHTIITFNQPTHQLTIKNIFPFEEMRKYNGVIDNQLLEEDLSDWQWLVETKFSVSTNF